MLSPVLHRPLPERTACSCSVHVSRDGSTLARSAGRTGSRGPASSASAAVAGSASSPDDRVADASIVAVRGDVGALSDCRGRKALAIADAVSRRWRPRSVLCVVAPGVPPSSGGPASTGASGSVMSGSDVRRTGGGAHATLACASGGATASAAALTLS